MIETTQASPNSVDVEEGQRSYVAFACTVLMSLAVLLLPGYLGLRPGVSMYMGAGIAVAVVAAVCTARRLFSQIVYFVPFVVVVFGVFYGVTWSAAHLSRNLLAAVFFSFVAGMPGLFVMVVLRPLSRRRMS